MTALDDALIDNVVTGHDGFPDYLACCLAQVEFGKIEHHPACSVVAARAERAALRKVTEAARAVLNSCRVAGHPTADQAHALGSALAELEEMKWPHLKN